MEIEIELSNGQGLDYGLEIGDPQIQGYYRKREWLSQRVPDGEWKRLYSIEDNRISDHQGECRDLPQQATGQERPYLAGPASFSEAFLTSEFLSSIFIYDLNHYVMWQLAPAGTNDNVLLRDGSNVAVVLDRIQNEHADVASERINAYLRYMAPQIEEVKSQAVGPYRCLSFKQTISGKEHVLSPPLSVSDGTLRAVGCLVAVAQEAKSGPPVRIVGIEEPENTIHPAAQAGLMSAFDEATLEKQVIITTHSPALLDRIDLDSHQLLVVEAAPEGSRISPMDRGSWKTLQQKLATLAELLFYDQLETDWKYLDAHKPDPIVPAGTEA